MNQRAFQELYQTFAPAVRARCRAICGNHTDADEALQETFLRAWNHRRTFDGRHPLAWLMTIARNTSLDVVRERKRWTDDPAVWLRLAAPRTTSGARLDAVRLLAEFTPEEAVMLRLRFAENWRIHEIAEHFDTSERTVRRKLERLQKRAAALFGSPLEVSHAG